MKWLKKKIFRFLKKSESKSVQSNPPKITPPFDENYSRYQFLPDVIAEKNAIFDEMDCAEFFRHFSDCSFTVQDYGNELYEYKIKDSNWLFLMNKKADFVCCLFDDFGALRIRGCLSGYSDKKQITNCLKEQHNWCYYPNGQEFAQKYGYTGKIADEVGLYVLFSADEKIVTAFQPWGLLYKLKIQKVLSGASK